MVPSLPSQVPGYSNIIKSPMDFTTIRQKLSSDMYLTWDALEADLVLMCTNCMTFNPPGAFGTWCPSVLVKIWINVSDIQSRADLLNQKSHVDSNPNNVPVFKSTLSMYCSTMVLSVLFCCRTMLLSVMCPFRFHLSH